MNRIGGTVAAMLLCVIASAQEQSIQWRQIPRPRLYLNAQRLDRIKRGIHGDYASVWSKIEKRADALTAQHPPDYSEHRDRSGDELWWEMDVAANLPVLALAHAVTGKQQYLDSAKEWTLASCAYPHWGMGARDGGDLSAGFMLLGVSAVYDWLYSKLDEEFRATMRRALIDHSRLMFDQSKKQAWKNAYLQNHMWITLAGLAASSGALMDDPEVSRESAV